MFHNRKIAPFREHLVEARQHNIPIHPVQTFSRCHQHIGGMKLLLLPLLIAYPTSRSKSMFPPLEENDEVVPLERSLPVLSTHLHLFKAVLFTQLSGCICANGRREAGGGEIMHMTRFKR